MRREYNFLTPTHQDEKYTRTQRICRFAFLLLLGAPSLDELAEISEPDFKELRDRLITRMTNTTVVAALAVSYVPN
ncbi:hypothetical protein BKA82DRAFT_4345648 [Pisolithus tinctorius]|nr:hypothetical protein BKA82DRAFT_4345648 [Pisolithus tinctorius]